MRPEIDLIGAAMTRGNIGSSSIISVAPVVLPPSTPAGKESHLYEAGVQVNVPLRNRVAQADAARDEIQLRQMQGRLQQLENQVRDEIENALTALQVGRAAYVAAVRSRQFQEQLLDAEIQKLSVGASVNFFIVQDEASWRRRARPKWWPAAPTSSRASRSNAPLGGCWNRTTSNSTTPSAASCPAARARRERVAQEQLEYRQADEQLSRCHVERNAPGFGRVESPL